MLSQLMRTKSNSDIPLYVHRFMTYEEYEKWKSGGQDEDVYGAAV